MITLLLINPIVMSHRAQLQKFTLYHFSFYSIQEEWEHLRKQKPISQAETRIGTSSYCTFNSKTSPEKITLTVVETQQLADIEQTDSKKEFYCLKWTIYFGRRKVCVNFKTDTDNLIFVVYCYWNNLYLKENEIDLKLTESQSLLAKRVYPLIEIDIFFKWCIELDGTTVHK